MKTDRPSKAFKSSAFTCLTHLSHSCKHDYVQRPEELLGLDGEPEQGRYLPEVYLNKSFTVSTSSRRSSGVPYLDEGAKKLVTCYEPI